MFDRDLSMRNTPNDENNNPSTVLKMRGLGENNITESRRKQIGQPTTQANKVEPLGNVLLNPNLHYQLQDDELLRSTQHQTEDNNDNKQNITDKFLGTRPKQYQQKQQNTIQKDKEQIGNTFGAPFLLLKKIPNASFEDFKSTNRISNHFVINNK